MCESTAELTRHTLTCPGDRGARITSPNNYEAKNSARARLSDGLTQMGKVAAVCSAGVVRKCAYAYAAAVGGLVCVCVYALLSVHVACGSFIDVRGCVCVCVRLFVRPSAANGRPAATTDCRQ